MHKVDDGMDRIFVWGKWRRWSSFHFLKSLKGVQMPFKMHKYIQIGPGPWFLDLMGKEREIGREDEIQLEEENSWHELSIHFEY